jgi:hypothetical protein
VNRLLAATFVLLLTVTGCSKGGAPQPTDAPKGPVGQPFELLAGGGTSPLADRALDLQLSGQVLDLEVAPDGTAYLLTAEHGTTRLDRIRPDGKHATLDLVDGQDVGSQVAVGPDGSAYVNLYWADKKRDAIYRIRPDGTRQLVISYNAAATTPGNRSIGTFGGLTVDPQGRLVFAVEVSIRGMAGVLIRRLEANGSVHTIAGRTTRFPTVDADLAATPAAVHPPANGKALDWATTGAMHVRQLATRPDGTIVLATSDPLSGGSNRTILAVTPQGSMSELAEVGADGLATAPSPFTREGDAQKVGNLFGALSVTGSLLAVSTANGTGNPPAGGNYDWVGDYTERQRAVLETARGYEIRLIRPDGSVMTAAYGNWFALHGDQLYVVTGPLGGGELLLGRVKIPT